MGSWWAIAILLCMAVAEAQAQLGDVKSNVTWRAGHVAAYLDPYVILYGGTESTSETYGGPVHGSTSLWTWDSRNGSWFNPQLASSTTLRPQVYFGATNLPSSGQMLIVGSNSSSGTVLQKLDTNSWSWSFPSSTTTSPSSSAQFAITIVNNTVFTYGGLSVDANGAAQSGAIVNSLYKLDANSFGWTSSSNGQGIAGHSACYVKSCNCLISFGGSPTGNGADATSNMYIYELARGVWNIQVSVDSSASGAPGARNLHTASCLSDKMIVYGGGTTAPFDSDVWVLDVSKYPTLSWQRVDMKNKDQGPGTRMGHSAALDESGQKMYIFGGWGGSATGDNNMYILDMAAWSWTKVSPAGLSSTTNPSGTTGNTSSSSNTGAIVGGAVGGVVGAALIGALLFFLWRRRRRQQSNSELEKTDDAEYYENYPQYWTNGDDNHYDMNNPAMVPPPMSPFPPNKRISKALDPGMSYRDSITTHGVRSELGDTGHVVTGVLEEVDGASDVATNYANNNGGSYHNSRHNSKTLLMPDGMLRNGKFPEEVISQKPNEFSMPASRLAAAHGGLIPIDHYTQSPASITATVGLPLSAAAIGTTGLSQGSHEYDGSNTQGSNTQDGNTSSPDHEALREQQIALAPLLNMLPRRYQVDQNLQPIQGPMNSIIFVNKTDNSQPVVIKWFGRREAWERECRTLIRLKSGHVVELLEVLTIQDESSPTAVSNSSNEEDEGENVKYVTVMERLDETLSAAIRTARTDGWSPEHTREIVRNIVECLVLCHSRGIAFCDLKPSNIMHRSDGPWKLIDFEASRTIGEECVGVITPRYCPPEVARATTYGLEGAHGVVATPSVDLWALGCVIYELETKHALFATNIKDETILHFVSHPSPSTPILNNGLRWSEQKELYIPNLERTIPDATTRELVQTLLSRDPARRGTASELLNHPYFLHEQ